MRSRRPFQKKLVDRNTASFRDLAGFVYTRADGSVLRQVHQSGLADFISFVSSGLYQSLTSGQQLVRHVELPLTQAYDSNAVRVLEPQQIPFITYPFEWSFGQLKDAALLTLSIQKQALARNISLKDASAYNVQFIGPSPIFIDTLSFETYQPGAPWQAYRQFCQHFLAPLALMSYTDISLSQLLRVHLDGIPLELVKNLLPQRAKLNPTITMHLVLHGNAQTAKSTSHKKQTYNIPKKNLEAIIDSLERGIKKLSPKHTPTEWADYYNNTNYTPSAADNKAMLVTKMIKQVKPKTVLDLGGNNGQYSRILNDKGIFTICSDIDPNAVEANFQISKLAQNSLMLPMLIDLTNPGGSIGWANNERPSISRRLTVDVVLALALVHHLAISNNVPFSHIAEYFSEFGEYLVIEFVPKDDSQVQKLLLTRNDIFGYYTEAVFKQEFDIFYTLVTSQAIPGTKRTLYFFKKRP